MLRAVPPDMPAGNFSRAEDVDPGIESFDESSRIAKEHLPDQEWARDANVQLRDGDTLFYYAQSWKQSDEKRSVKFEPLALVWFQEDAVEPLIIQAESALVTFERDVDLSSPDPGRIVAGELLGDVSIRGADGLAMNGQHFIFSEESGSIFSDNPVDFAWQKHSGTSQQGIQIDLVMATGGPSNQLAVTGVKEVHLIRNVEMDFLFDQDEELIPLSVRCAGRFMLRLLGKADNPASRSIATFEDKVVVRRATELNTSDVMTCDQLVLHLEETTEAEKAARKLAGKSESGLIPGSDESALQFKRMIAKGYVVKVTSELNEFQAVVGSPNQQQRSMAVVDYDAAERRLTLNDFDPTLVKQWKPRVRVIQKSGEMDCQQIVVTHHADGRVDELLCRGHGWLAYREPGEDGGPATDVLLADWKRQLRRFTDTTTGQNVIDLFGEAVVKMPADQAGISANYIKIWTDPLESSSNASSFLTGNASQRDGEDKPKNAPKPRRILAQKEVLLISPQMHGQMEELQVWFEDADPPRERSGLTDELTPVSYRVPEAAAPLLLPDEDDSKKLKEPVFVSADLTRVRIVRYGDEVDPEVREVWTEGDVRITHHRESASGPVVLTGDRLHILNNPPTSNSPTQQIVHILGSPAQILDPKMKLTGEEITVDRSRNIAWTDGTSELRLPTDRDFDGKLLKEPAELTINSHEQMSFDGRVATFTGRVHASMFDSVMRCQQMEVTMLKPIVFDEGMEQAERPEIATVTCQFDVEFNSHVMEEGTLKEVRRAKFARFHLDHRTGKVFADNGPGTVSLWRRGRGKRAGLAPLAAAGANRAMDTQGTEWEYSRIKFARDMSGSVKNRTTTFRGQIEVIYGPVGEPLVKIDLYKLPKDGGAMFCDWLEFVQRSDSDGTKHVELLAKENARLEGRSFFAQADEISFDESKGLYMLRSSGDESILWREKVAGGERTAVVAETFRFIPSINKVEFDKASRVQGLQ